VNIDGEESILFCDELACRKMSFGLWHCGYESEHGGYQLEIVACAYY